MSTSRFSVINNGGVAGFVKPSRGLRQGCPLSPCFFYVLEGLSAAFRRAETLGSLRDVGVSRNTPRVDHHFFVDDSIVFGEASLTDCEAIGDILRLYEKASGQMVDFE